LAHAIRLGIKPFAELGANSEASSGFQSRFSLFLPSDLRIGPGSDARVSEIHEFAGTDYAYRLFVQKYAWTQMLARLAEETDYDNFKSEVARYQGRNGAAYEHSLHEVWSVMHRLQK
jgi:hypothetical protein